MGQSLFQQGNYRKFLFSLNFAKFSVSVYNKHILLLSLAQIKNAYDFLKLFENKVYYDILVVGFIPLHFESSPVAQWVKDLAFLLQQLRSLLSCGFDPWPRNIHMPGVHPKKPLKVELLYVPGIPLLDIYIGKR